MVIEGAFEEPMQTTKQQILTLLKRSGCTTVEEAAAALSIASMTARQHLIGLERDGLVQAEKVRRTQGRPHFLFTLTPKGDEMFPRRFDLLAQALLDEVGELSAADIEHLPPMERRALLIQRSADRLAERFRFQAEGRTLGERVAAVTDVLHLIGGFAEWRQTGAAYEILDYNCIFARLGDEGGDDCPWHVRLLTRLLQWPVSHQLRVDGSVRCCVYRIEPDAKLAAEGLID